jgi:hypothetical protein
MAPCKYKLPHDDSLDECRVQCALTKGVDLLVSNIMYYRNKVLQASKLAAWTKVTSLCSYLCLMCLLLLKKGLFLQTEHCVHG